MMIAHTNNEVLVRDDLKKRGYSKEDEYFHRKDRELLEKLREKADAQRSKLVSKNEDAEYWMRCPKCGSPLKDEKYGDVVLIDRCTSKECGGIFLDAGELEILLRAKPSLLQRIFGR
jgi:Zn-finger nucleic acid-binding protein